MDVWILYDTDDTVPNLLGVFVDAHAALSWLIYENRDSNPAWTRRQENPDEVLLVGDFPPIPGQAAGWARSYIVIRRPVLEGP